jgi:hypothetical protein
MSCWYDTIQAIRARKLELARLDPRAGMPVMPPSGATPANLAAIERRLKRPLPPTYRAFLAQHDGWPRFYHGTTLLSAKQLTRGNYVDVVRLVTSDVESASPNTSSAPPSTGSLPGVVGAAVAPPRVAPRAFRASLIPFGIDDTAETIFAFDPSAQAADGELEVIVWINQIGERLESFPAFLELVHEMLGGDILERGGRIEDHHAPTAAPAIVARSHGAASKRATHAA